MMRPFKASTLVNAVKFADITYDRSAIYFHYIIDNQSFQTALQYEKDINIYQLIDIYSRQALEKIFFHIGMIIGMQALNVYPKRFEIAEHLTCHHTDDFIKLFNTLYNGIFAQHHWENNHINYPGVEFDAPTTGANVRDPIVMIEPKKQILLSCGGGKDSLLCIKLLEKINIDFSIVQYAHSHYGNVNTQHKIINKLTKNNQHQSSEINIIEQFNLQNIKAITHNQVTTYTSPETPIGLFATLPVMLAKGHLQLCVGHERDADTEGNFFWIEKGIDINHQYGKTLDAEKHMSDYIAKHLIKGFKFFSLLKPIHDFMIFQLLADYAYLLPLTHSCNIKKPWCKKCPKCLYVWLNCKAYCDIEVFAGDVLNRKEHQKVFEEMLGISGYKPFECIGEIDATRLAVYTLKRRGMTGSLINLFDAKIQATEDFCPNTIFEKMSTIYRDQHAIPHFISEKILPIFEKQAARIRAHS